jgi:hypothetical protein
MAQQLNLLDAGFRTVRTKLSGSTMMIAAGAVYAAMFLYESTEMKAKRAFDTRKAETDSKITALTVDLEKAKQSAKKREPDKRLVEEVARHELRLQAQREILTALETGGLGSSEGFSKYFAALARQRVEGLWLTKIGVNAADNNLVIGGRMLTADLLPTYIKALNKDDVLRGRRFGDLKLVSQKQKLPEDPPEVKAAKALSASQSPAKPAAPPKPTEITVLEFELGAPAKAN